MDLRYYLPVHRRQAYDITCNMLSVYKQQRVVMLMCYLYRDSKGKGHPMTWLCRQRGEAGVQLQPIRNPVLEVVDGQHHSSAALLEGKTRYLLYKRLGWARGRSRRRRGIASTLGFDPRTCPAHRESLYTSSSL